MAYTYERLISDLEHDENWNVIRERANNEKFDFDTINEDEFIQDDEQEISENNAEEITDMFSQLI